MPVTDSDFEALTPQQQQVLGLVAINMGDGQDPTVLEQLRKLGMIRRLDQRARIGGLPWVTFYYDMPVSVHIAWCDWCSRTVPDEEI